MEEVVRKALDRRKELVLELRELDRFLKTAQQFGSSVIKNQAIDASLEVVRGAWKKAPRPSDLVEATVQLLRTEGRPLARGALFKKLSDAGIHMPGKDPIKNYGTILWRSQCFDNSGGEYWPRGDVRPQENIAREN